MAVRSAPIQTGDLEVRAVTRDSWSDVVTLLGGKTERGCWCQSWRGSAAAAGFSGLAANREALRHQVDDGAVAPGVIAYLDREPIGWCGLGPRADMPRLANSRTIPAVDAMPVWAIGCFVVRPGFRRRGVARALLGGAVAYARRMGAPAIEAYPIDPAGGRVSTAFGFVGFTSMFEAAGFRRVVVTRAHSAGLSRWLMRLDLA